MMNITLDFVKHLALFSGTLLDDDRALVIVNSLSDIYKRLQLLREVDLSDFEPAVIFRPLEDEHEK
jgi:Asp-tRNA(Asn)/Glu-tRNA(Gln) amidotransferase C subunit